MKKYLLLLLLFTGLLQAQTYPVNPTKFGKISLNTNVPTTQTKKIVSQDTITGELNYIDADNFPIPSSIQDSLAKKLNLPTGFLYGLQLSINADPTKFDIAAGYYTVTDFSNLAQPAVKIIYYPGGTGLTPSYLATSNSTYVALDINGDIVSSASPFTNEDRRTLAIIGNVVHSNNTTINVVNEIKAPIVAFGNQLHDFMKEVGFLNSNGNIYSPNGANLMINKSAGRIFGMGINAADYLNPHVLTIAEQTAPTFAYRLQTGTQLADTNAINPNIYDVGGVSTAIPGGSWWTIQRINLFQSGLTRIQPGQTIYPNFNSAVTNLPTEAFVTEQNIAENAVFRCYLIVEKGTTDLAAAVAAGTARFVPVDKFGNVINSGSVPVTAENIIAALGYTPENVANKTDSYTTSSSTAYVSGKALVEGLASIATVEYATVVYFNDTNPATATIFDDENPPTINDPLLKDDTDNLYIGNDASTWVYNGSIYVTKSVPSTSNFYINGTTTDAGSDKNSNIYRIGGAIYGGNLQSYGGGLSTSKGNSDTATAGSFVMLSNNVGTNKGMFQLNATYGIDLWNLDSGVWSKKIYFFGSRGF